MVDDESDEETMDLRKTESKSVQNASLNSFLKKIGKCEKDNSKIRKNIESERFQEPRMFTMAQIRNVIFACLNQSTAVQRISKTESHINKIHDTCLRLDEIDNMLKKECELINVQLNQKINQWKLDAD